MPTLEELRRELDRDELDYPALAVRLGRAALRGLHSLVAEDEPRIASKAVYLAALIGGPAAGDVVSVAARSQHGAVRVSAAAALEKLPPDQGVGIAGHLMSDPDVGVRARAAKSAANVADLRMTELLSTLSDNDPHAQVRALAARLITSG